MRYLLFIIFFCTSVFIQAQEPFADNHLTEKDGLPGKEFFDIVEDDAGFIWLAANKGLFRYDGKNFTKYTHKIQKRTSIFGTQIDPLGRVWCNNVSGQFFYVKDQKLVLFTNLSKLLKGSLANFIVTKKYVWIFTYKTIYRVDLETKLLETVHKVKDGSRFGVPFKFKNKILYSNEDTIYSITEKDEIVPFASIKIPLKDKPGKRLNYDRSRLFSIKDKLFYRQKIAGVNRVFSVDLVNEKLDEITGFDAISKEQIYNEFISVGGELCLLANSGSWVYVIIKNKASLVMRNYKEANISKVLLDRDENLWVTTLNKGIYIIPNTSIQSKNFSLKNRNITCLEKVSDSLLFSGMDNGRVVQYNLNTNQEKIINLPFNYRVSVLKYHPYKKTLIISADGNHSVEYNLETQKLQQIKQESVKSAEILKNNDFLYIGYNKLAICKNANFVTKRETVFSGKRSYTTYYNVDNEDIYLAVMDNLMVYDKYWNKKSITYKNEPIYVKSITKTANGTIWAATFNQGIFGIKNSKVIKHYSDTNKLKSNSIQKIKADENNLWIALDNSIQMLDVVTEKVKIITKIDGVLSYDISGIEIVKNRAYFSSNEGLFSLDRKKSFKKLNPKLYFDQFTINDKDTLVVNNYQLKYNQNNIKIGFNVNGYVFNRKGKYKYRLKGLNDQWFTTDIGETTIKYNSLPSGKYTFEVQPLLEGESTEKVLKQLAFTIKKPFWKTWWFISSIFILYIGAIVFYFKRKIKKKEQERIQELEKISLEKELISINLTALRSQMNPHFIFNALNSIQDLILKEDTEASYDYIVLFAQLIRSALNYSNQDFIPIEEEVKFLSVYLQLEQLRFGKDFSYNVKCDVQEGLQIPSLLIQPFIENALVHGLMHKTGKKELSIIFSFQKDILKCVITDNGIGRKKASEISTRQGGHHKSFALSAIKKRLDIFKKQHGNTIGYDVHDLYEKDQATGTKVVLKIPSLKKF